MKIRVFISSLAILLFSLSGNFLPSVSPTLPADSEKNQTEIPAEEAPQEEQVSISQNFEAVFQVFHFNSKIWSTQIFDFKVLKNFVPASIEFLIRDFVVPRNLTLFRQFISRNAP